MRLISVTCAASLLFAGCTGMRPSQQAEGLASGDVIRKSTEVTGAESKLVYLLLAAELAGQRGQLDVSLDNYMKAANISPDPRIAARATQIGLYLKDPEKARAAATLWRQRDPENAESLRLLAMLELKAGHREEALAQFSALLNRKGVDLESTLIEMVKLLDAEVGQDDAFSFMDQLLTRFPRMAEIHFAYALLAADKKEYKKALDQTEKALALHPDWGRARLLQAQVMSQMGDSQTAREVIQKALKSDPGNNRLRLIYSQFLAKAGDTRAAEKELATLLVKDPANEDARFGLGMAQIENGLVEKARKTFMELSENSRWKLQSYFYLGLIEAKKGRLQAAQQWFNKVTEGPLAFDAQVNSITAQINVGQLTEARQRLGEVRKKFPSEALRLYLLEAELLSKNKDYSSAFDLLSEALDENPGQVELLYTRALIAEQLDRLDVLEADLRAVLEKKPDDPNALNALGYTLADRGERLEEAKKLLDRAIELKPDDPAILDSFGWLGYRMGNKEAALTSLRRAYELFNDPEIGSHLGEVLWESGKQKEARKVWRESLKKDPASEDMEKIKVRYPEAFR